MAGQPDRQAEALERIRQGDLPAAAAIYRALLDEGSRDPGVFATLAALLWESGERPEAIALLRRALALAPDDPEALHTLGSALQQDLQDEAAIDCFRAAIRRRPDHAEAHRDLAVSLLRQGESAAAIACCEEALRLRPGDAETHTCLGHARLQRGEAGAAVAAFQQALALRPERAEGWLELGHALERCGDLDAAADAFEAALALRPDFAEAHYNLANVRKRRGDLEAAAAGFERALALRPDFADAHYNLANTRRQLGDTEAAIAGFRRALAARPEFPPAELNLGGALQEQGDLAAAIACYERALALDPDYAEAHVNLGNALLEQGAIGAAGARYARAVALRPDLAEAQLNRALVQLLEGNYAEGWEGFEWRFRSERHRGLLLTSPRLPRWAGEPLEPGATLLLVAEQGLGDTLQFVRYLAPLRERGLAVRLCAPEPLHGLIRSCGVDPDPLDPERAGAITDGRWLPLLSLPGLLGVSAADPQIRAPYLRAGEERVREWRSRLAGEGRPVVALSWQGNPEPERSGSRGRSLPLETFAPLAACDVALLSLQKGFGSEQLERCSFRDRFVGCQEAVDQAWDFEETAAIVAACDLVITSDTAVAHLAGALGRPTWLLLKSVPDWRWGLEGESTPWYPSLRLFRQRRAGDWAEVLERVRAELPAFLERQAPPRPPRPATLRIPVSLGELVDKITILEIKAGQLDGPALANVREELRQLGAVLDGLGLALDPERIEALRQTNRALWTIEDEIREHERRRDFGPSFIELARSVYFTNDRRSAIKREINLAHGSSLIEEKSYTDYAGDSDAA